MPAGAWDGEAERKRDLLRERRLALVEGGAVLAVIALVAARALLLS